MTRLLTGLAVGAAMLMGVGAAQAEPLTLSAAQMDGVTAGGFLSIAKARSEATAVFGRFTLAKTSTETAAAPGFAWSKSKSKSVSAG